MLLNCLLFFGPRDVPQDHTKEKANKDTGNSVDRSLYYNLNERRIAFGGPPPPPDNLTYYCECNHTGTSRLKCSDLSLTPKIENTHFEFCELNGVNSSMVHWENVTCNELRIRGQTSNIASIKNLKFRSFIIINIGKNFMDSLFEIKSPRIFKNILGTFSTIINCEINRPEVEVSQVIEYNCQKYS